ncbi:MAG: DUF1501 domain-containing protein [Planctomycetota bacterium]
MCDHYHPQSCNTPPPSDAGFTRRRFLGHGLGLVSAATTVPAFLLRAGDALAADTTMRLTSKPGVPDGRVLVVVQLSGGNDGLNTVVPFAHDEYQEARPLLRIRPEDALRIPGSDDIGLHPALTPLQEMIDARLAGIVQGVGYPNPNRSHFASMGIWHSGQVENAARATRGWIGSALDQAPDPTALDIINVGREAPLATLGKHTRSVSFENANLFRWAGRDLHSEVSDTYDAFHDQAVEAGEEDPLAFVNRTALDAQVASSRVRKAVRGGLDTPWPQSGLANQLKMVAKMIRAELPTRVYYVNMGGFDTHANQLGNHNRLMQQFGAAMQAFYQELDAAGHRSRVVSLAFSEFGRRVQQNASNGTDHGVAGPAFVFGDAVKPGLLGEHPSLRKLDKGDLVHRVDFRSLYTDILENWMKLDAATALGKKYRPAGIFRSTA